MPIIVRTNKMGMTYQISSIGFRASETTISLIRNDKESSKIIVPFTLNEISQSWYDWTQRGLAIQEAFPHFSPDQREFLMTGITKAEWDEMFPDEDDDDFDSEEWD